MEVQIPSTARSASNLPTRGASAMRLVVGPGVKPQQSTLSYFHLRLLSINVAPASASSFYLQMGLSTVGLCSHSFALPNGTWPTRGLDKSESRFELQPRSLKRLEQRMARCELLSIPRTTNCDIPQIHASCLSTPPRMLSAHLELHRS